MLALQYFRGILLLNNLIAAIISFVVGVTGWYAPSIMFVMGGFLMASWVMSIMVLLYTAVQRQPTRKAGYFRLPAQFNDSGDLDSNQSESSKMGFGVLVLITLADTVFGISFIVIGVLSLVHAHGADAAVASVGAIVAAVIHNFYVLTTCYYGSLRKYKVKVSIVRRDQGDSLRDMSGGKEQRTSEQSSTHEPESLSPKPYRGSPSTKPSNHTQLSSDGPISLIEPTEGDRLIADHD